MKYIDAEKLKAEIERQIEEEKNNLTEETNLYYGTRQQVRSTILRIIDSLQQEQNSVQDTELTYFESALFTAFSYAWQDYLRGEEVNVAQWAKENSAELLEAAKFQQEQPEVDIEKEYTEFVASDPVYSKLVNGIVGKSIARHFYELGLKVRKEK